MGLEPAPLVAADGVPLPQGIQGLWLEGQGGARLRIAVAPPTASARGSVVLSPGRTEPIEKYFEVIGELQARGLHVLVHDWRGQGLSHRMLADRLKGHAENPAHYLEDFRRLLDWAAGVLPRPWLGFGHSMGGTLTAMAALGGERRIDGIFLSAPMMGVAAVRRLPGAARLLARGMARLGRGADYVVRQGFDPMLGPFESNILTHDRSRYARYRAQLAACPDLAIGGVTWGWLSFALDAGVALSRPGAPESLDLPLTVAAAADERLVLNGPARAFAERAPQGRYAEIPGAFHELFMETDARRALAWAEFDRLAARAGAG